METLIPYITISVILIICCMPAVIWWFIKYIPLLIMSCSKVCCIIIFLAIAYWACGNDLHNPEGRREWKEKIEGDAGEFNYSGHNINTSSAGKAIVVEDDER
jgi:hypothetical protein